MAALGQCRDHKDRDTNEQMGVGRSILAGLLVAVFAMGLAGCRESEQDRPLGYEKGVYGGKPDTALSDEQRRDLQHRGRNQKF